jgi:hypothetical protein
MSKTEFKKICLVLLNMFSVVTIASKPLLTSSLVDCFELFDEKTFATVARSIYIILLTR